jgi:hypothetical protein
MFEKKKDSLSSSTSFSQSTTGSGSAAANRKEEKAKKVHYKFNEGFSNAVKRTVFIKDFLK